MYTNNHLSLHTHCIYVLNHNSTQRNTRRGHKFSHRLMNTYGCCVSSKTRIMTDGRLVGRVGGAPYEVNKMFTFKKKWYVY